MGGSTLDIHVEGARMDMARTVRWKDGIVARLTGGVAKDQADSIPKNLALQLAHPDAPIAVGASALRHAHSYPN